MKIDVVYDEDVIEVRINFKIKRKNKYLRRKTLNGELCTKV